MTTPSRFHPGEGSAWRHARPRSVRTSVERRDHSARDELARRVLSEFREMPCLRLTPKQAQRLFGLRPDVSTRVIGELIRSGHLRKDADGRYAATIG